MGTVLVFIVYRKLCTWGKNVWKCVLMECPTIRISGVSRDVYICVQCENGTISVVDVDDDVVVDDVVAEGTSRGLPGPSFGPTNPQFRNNKLS